MNTIEAPNIGLCLSSGYTDSCDRAICCGDQDFQPDMPIQLIVIDAGYEMHQQVSVSITIIQRRSSLVDAYQLVES